MKRRRNVGPRSAALDAAQRAGLRRYQPVAFAAMLFCLGVIARSDSSLPALVALTVFLTYPVYPFVIQRAEPAL